MTTSDSNRKVKLPLNEFRRVDGHERAPQDRSIPDDLKPHFHQDGNAYRSAHRQGKIEFVDRASRMHAYRPVSTFTVRALASIAASRGWQELELTGDKKFRSAAYVEATSRGLTVRGYTPTPEDQQALARREERKAAGANPKVQAFVKATDPASMAKAVVAFPDLKDAFAARSAVEARGAEIADVKGRANWVGALKDRIAMAIHRGEAIPEVKIRDAGTPSRDDRSAETPEQ